MVTENNHSLAEESSFSPFEGMTEDEIHELIQVFLDDASEQLVKLNAILLSLEKGNYSQDDIQNLYRIFHSFKGSAASFGFKEISQVSHQLEDILAPVRNGQIRISDSLTSLLFYALDKFQLVFQNVKEGKPYDDILSLLSDVIEKYVITPQPTVKDAESPFPFIPSVPQELNYEISLREESIRIKLQKINRLIDLSSEMAVRKNYGQVNIPKIMNIMEKVQAKENEILAFIREGGKGNNGSQSLYPVQGFCQGILEFTNGISGGLKVLLDDFSRWFFQLNILAEELRYEALMTRMFPLSIMTTQMKRVVRDLAKVLNKKVTLEIIGEETEIDRRILEELKDPLIHILRNAVDHGIESPELRIQQGKTPFGVITIHASQTGNAIILDITDDGAGIDNEVVRRMALERLCPPYSPEMIAALSPEEILNLIFVPGFSTSKNVSEVSGRGVGLDVVQNNIKRLHGQIMISSRKGEGTTFHIRIPSTLTIASVLIFDVGPFVFALDTSVIVRTVLLNSIEVKSNVDNLIVKYQGKEYPVVKLRDYLKIPTDGKSEDTYNIVLMNFDGRGLGLLVDSFLDHQEIIIRPLQIALEEARYFSGITFLPDGTSAFILAPDTLLNDLKKVRITSHENDDLVIELASIQSEDEFRGIQIPLLLLRIGKDLVGVPAHYVLRQFQIFRQPVRSRTTRRSLAFGKNKIPLIDMSVCLGIDSDADSDKETALICLINERVVALEIDEVMSKEMGWLNADKSHHVKQGALKALLKDGKEILMIHSELLIPYLQSEAESSFQNPVQNIVQPDKHKENNFIEKPDGEINLIKCQIGNRYFGIPFHEVQEIVPSAEIFCFDGKVDNPRGFITLRGECIEIFNLCVWLPDIQDIPSLDYVVVVVLHEQVKRGFIVQQITTEMELLSGQSPVKLPPEISPIFPPVYLISSKDKSPDIKGPTGV